MRYVSKFNTSNIDVVDRNGKEREREQEKSNNELCIIETIFFNCLRPEKVQIHYAKLPEFFGFFRNS